MSARRTARFGVAAAMALALLTSGAATGSAAELIGAPVTGYVYDPGARGIRPINGIPGSATLGAPVPLSFDLASAVISGRGAFGLARSGQDGGMWIVGGLGNEQPSVKPLPAGIADAQIAMNALGSAAVLYSASALQFVSGLPDQASVGDVTGLPDFGGRYSAAALSGDGNWALLGVTGESGGGVYLARNPRSMESSGSDSVPVLLARLNSPSAMVLVNGDKDAIVADQTSNKVYLLRDVRGSADLIPISDARTPVAVQVVRNDQMLLVVNAGDSSVAVIDLASLSVVQTLPLAGSASRCSALGGDVFLLNDPGSSPLLLLDAAESGFRSVFVPVPQGF